MFSESKSGLITKIKTMEIFVENFILCINFLDKINTDENPIIFNPSNIVAFVIKKYSKKNKMNLLF